MTEPRMVMLNDMCILGIDPGTTGALAFYYMNAPGRVAVEDIPLAGGEIAPALLANRIKTHGPSLAMVERVGAMTGWGVSSTFKFGSSVGVIKGVLGALNVPVYYISPAKWKRYFTLTKDKEFSRAKAISLFPKCADSFGRKADHNRAEAALIAKYAAETMFPWSAPAP